MSKITYNDKSYDFNEIRDQLDPSLLEELEDNKFGSDQDFFESYLVRHHEKYNEQFEVR
ncbi:hypothetical protein ISP15_03245 [Dyella jejuensis]|uniref:AcrIC5-like domain-containing protein n=1 Tax=Dyella jejuensis TaxID=1432009 RepID=A0ABW8JGD2_9GAMM